jgi:hypothetical protein
LRGFFVFSRSLFFLEIITTKNDFWQERAVTPAGNVYL